MAVALDANTTGTPTSGSTSSLTITHVVGSAGANGLLFVAAGYQQSSAVTVTGVTYNSVAMTQVPSAYLDGNCGFSIHAGIDLWYLMNEATGSHDVVISTSGNACIYGVVSSWTGVDSSVPLGTAVTAGGASGTTTATTGSISVTSGNMLVGGCTALSSSTASFTSGNTELGEAFKSGTDSLCSGSSYRTDTGALTWTGINNYGTLNWVVSAVELKASGGAATPALRRNSSLNGLGASGSFFHDPLAKVGGAFARAVNSGLYVPRRMAA